MTEFNAKTFGPFAEAVDGLLDLRPDPFIAIQSVDNDAKDLWYCHQAEVGRELKDATEQSELQSAVIRGK